jgi:hypothetical protein
MFDGGNYQGYEKSASLFSRERLIPDGSGLRFIVKGI